MKRAVITGLGVVSSIGNNQQEVLASLQEGRSGITFSQELKDSGMRSHVWGQVKLDTTGLIDRKAVRFMSDASIYAFLAMQEAIASSGLKEEEYQNNPRVGLIAGSGGGSPRFQVFGADAMRSPRGLKAVGPYVVTKAMASGVSACLATPFKIHGVNYSISSACATSAHCIGNAVEQIQLGKQDIVFAGGGEELCWEMACEFDAMGALSTKYNDTPENAQETAACCCVDVGTVMDNTDCTASYSQVFSNQQDAEAMLAALSEKARAVESDPCDISSSIKPVDGGVQLEADFTFACQAETLIFQLGLR